MGWGSVGRSDPPNQLGVRDHHPPNFSSSEGASPHDHPSSAPSVGRAQPSGPRGSLRCEGRELLFSMLSLIDCLQSAFDISSCDPTTIP